jgi:hypothetical protein
MDGIDAHALLEAATADISLGAAGLSLTGVG